MEKQRDIVTLLRVMRRKIYRVKSNHIGLCGLTVYLSLNKLVSDRETIIIDEYIERNLMKGHSGYYWKPGKILPRYIWLTKQIIKERRKKDWKTWIKPAIWACLTAIILTAIFELIPKNPITTDFFAGWISCVIFFMTKKYYNGNY